MELKLSNYDRIVIYIYIYIFDRQISFRFLFKFISIIKFILKRV